MELEEKKKLLKNLYNKLSRRGKSIYKALYGPNGVNGKPYSWNIDFVIERLKATLKYEKELIKINK